MSPKAEVSYLTATKQERLSVKIAGLCAMDWQSLFFTTGGKSIEQNSLEQLWLMLVFYSSYFLPPSFC